MANSETKTARAGTYRYYLQHQSITKASNGTTSYTNDFFVWAAIEDMTSKEEAIVGAAILTTKVLIRIRNYVPIFMSDRLVDTANGFTYFVDGTERSFANNETWVIADRKQLGLTS